MDGEAAAAVTLAAVCVVGLGMVAATMESTIETTPDDQITVDSSTVPFGMDELKEYDRRVNQNPDRERDVDVESKQQTPPGAVSRSDSETENQQDVANPKIGPPGAGRLLRDGGERARSAEGDGGQRGGDHHSRDESTDESLLDRLQSLLVSVYSWLFAHLALLLTLLLGAVLVARREAITSRWFGTEESEGSPGDHATRRVSAPANEVSRAWVETVRLLDVDDEESKTPREVATLAEERGVDRSAVERVRRAFEEVRYGHAEVTPDRRRQALEGLERIRSQRGGDR